MFYKIIELLMTILVAMDWNMDLYLMIDVVATSFNRTTLPNHL